MLNSNNKGVRDYSFKKIFANEEYIMALQPFYNTNLRLQ